MKEQKKVNYGLTFSFNAFRFLLAVTTFISGLKASQMLGVDLPAWTSVLVALLLVLGIDMSLDYVLKQLLSMDGKKDEDNAMDPDNAPALWYGAAIVFLFATGGTTFFSGIIIGEGSADYVGRSDEREQQEQARKNKVADIAELRRIIRQDSTALIPMKAAWARDTAAAIHSTSSAWNIKTWQNGSWGNYSRKESPYFFRYIDNILRIDSTHAARCAPIESRLSDNRAQLAGLVTRDTDKIISDSVAAHNAREADTANKLASFIWLMDVFSVVAVVVLFFLIRNIRRRDGVEFDVAAHSFVQWLMDRSSETNNTLLSSLADLVRGAGTLIASVFFRTTRILAGIEDIFRNGLELPKEYHILGFTGSGGGSQPKTPDQEERRAQTGKNLVRTRFEGDETHPGEGQKVSATQDFSEIVRGFSDLQTFLASITQPKQPETLVRTERTEFDVLENEGGNEFLHNGARGVQAMNRGDVKSKFNLYFTRCAETARRILKAREEMQGEYKHAAKQKEARELRTLENRARGDNGLAYWRMAYERTWGEDLFPEALKGVSGEVAEIIKQAV